MCLSHMLTIVMYYVTAISFVVIFSGYTSAEKEWSHCAYNQNETTLTCAHQLMIQDAEVSNCIITHYKKNTSVCKDLKITTNTFNIDTGKVRLHVYYHGRRNFPNVTFSDIKWDFLRMQYKTRKTNTTNFCREFNLSTTVPPSTELFYDCMWFDAIDYGGYEFDFRYEAHNTVNAIWEGRHYIFKLPKSKDPGKTHLNDWELFMYMDISELPIITIYWDPPPEHFHVKGYEVHAYHKTEESNDTIKFDLVPSNLEPRYRFHIGSISGTVFVTVRLQHDNCTADTCFVSVSPFLNIGRGSQTPLLIGIVGSVVLLPVFLYAFYVWRRYGLLSNGSTPAVLIIYRQSLTTHTKAVVALAQYLRDFCQVHAVMDELDIPHSETKNPFMWYQEAFLQVDTVVVLSSPLPFSSDREGIYHNVDTVGLRLLAEKFSDPLCTHRFFSVLLPYCSEGDIPLEASNLQRFTLMQDLNEMLWYIHNGSKYSWLSKLEYCCFQSRMPGGLSDFKINGQPLIDTFAKAGADVENCYENLSPGLTKKCTSHSDLLFKEKVFTPSSCQLVPYKDSLLVEPNIDMHGLYEEFPGNITNLNLLGVEATSLTDDDKKETVPVMGFDVNDLPLSGR